MLSSYMTFVVSNIRACSELGPTTIPLHIKKSAKSKWLTKSYVLNQKLNRIKFCLHNLSPLSCSTSLQL